MQADSIPPADTPRDSTRREISALIAEIETLAHSELPPSEFYPAFLDRAVQATAAIGGAVWQWRSARPVLAAGRGLPNQFTDAAMRQRWLATVAGSDTVQVLPPQASSDHPENQANPTNCTLAAAPVVVQGKTVAVVELLLDHNASPAARHGTADFLWDLCELASDFHRNEELSTLRRLQAQSEDFESFALSIHGSLDLRRTAFAIANEGRRLVGCDRLSVIVWRNSRLILTAVSGVDAVNRRADSARRIERLAAYSEAAAEPIWYSGATDDMPPQIEQLIQQHVDDCHTRWLAIVPLLSAPDQNVSVGVLFAEDFTTSADDANRQQLVSIANHSAAALARALDHQAPPLMPLWLAMAGALSWLGWQRLPKTLLALALLAGIVIGLTVIPAEFNIRTRGQLLPRVRRDIFAPADGVVTQLHVQHGDMVEISRPLAKLDNADLDYEWERVQGELETNRERLSAVQILRISEPDGEEEATGQRTAETQSLQAGLASLEQQQQILRTRLGELELRAPIAGQIVTWQLEDRLQSRPVVRGQCLMQIADIAGPWELELQLPEHRVEHVLARQRSNGGRVDVSFSLETDSSRVFHGRIKQISMRVDTAPHAGRTITVTVAVEADAALPRRPGAGVVANIQCGRKPLGYVWFHDLWGVIQSRLFF